MHKYVMFEYNQNQNRFPLRDRYMVAINVTGDIIPVRVLDFETCFFIK